MDKTNLWTSLLKEALSKPGTLSEAYRRFWAYSPCNQLLALWQCRARKIELGPIASFLAWKRQGRFVKRGEHAIELCMPVTCKRTEKQTEADGRQFEAESVFTRFIFRRNWFVLSQTDGPAVPPVVSVPDWDKGRALAALGVSEVPFDELDGNNQGFANKTRFAVNPLAALPHKTAFHELAHILLGHTQEGVCSDSERTPRNVREMEAEGVALICCESLGLPGSDDARGYIQHWAQGSEFTEKSAQRIFGVAGAILKAGRPVVGVEGD